MVAGTGFDPIYRHCALAGYIKTVAGHEAAAI